MLSRLNLSNPVKVFFSETSEPEKAKGTERPSHLKIDLGSRFVDLSNKMFGHTPSNPAHDPLIINKGSQRIYRQQNVQKNHNHLRSIFEFLKLTTLFYFALGGPLFPLLRLNDNIRLKQIGTQLSNGEFATAVETSKWLTFADKWLDAPLIGFPRDSALRIFKETCQLLEMRRYCEANRASHGYLITPLIDVVQKVGPKWKGWDWDSCVSSQNVVDITKAKEWLNQNQCQKALESVDDIGSGYIRKKALKAIIKDCNDLSLQEMVDKIKNGWDTIFDCEEDCIAVIEKKLDQNDLKGLAEFLRLSNAHNRLFRFNNIYVEVAKRIKSIDLLEEMSKLTNFHPDFHLEIIERRMDTDYERAFELAKNFPVHSLSENRKNEALELFIQKNSSKENLLRVLELNPAPYIIKDSVFKLTDQKEFELAIDHAKKISDYWSHEVPRYIIQRTDDFELLKKSLGLFKNAEVYQFMLDNLEKAEIADEPLKIVIYRKIVYDLEQLWDKWKSSLNIFDIRELQLKIYDLVVQKTTDPFLLEQIARTYLPREELWTKKVTHLLDKITLKLLDLKANAAVLGILKNSSWYRLKERCTLVVQHSKNTDFLSSLKEMDLNKDQREELIEIIG